MADASPMRRQLLRPFHLFALSLAAAIFAGVVVLITMGFFQWKGEQLQPLVVQQALLTAGVCAGLSFIAMAVGLPLLMLFVDPADFGDTFAGPVLMRHDGDAPTQDPTAAESPVPRERGPE